ncbi:unnamed protein product [Adineta ricciae]|uniref:Uncharacterized protein n=1 Tax=Adineta ricciae TaxID=249248 RepID=A0A815Z7T7_ADIRI|nr:unnamed protein product [Adineta ricciae]
MNSSSSSPSKSSALEVIKNYRVSELQALLDFASLSRQGQKRDLLQRCKILISSNFTPQLANKIQQINNTRTRPSRSNHVSSSTTSSRHQPIVLPKTPPTEVLPQANHIQFTSLPFFEKMRTIECANMPIDWHTFTPIRFVLNETDIDLIRKNTAKVFLRIAPTVVSERHNDILPPYLFVQCNNQPVINNNVSKQVGSQAHSISFPTDFTDKIILKANASNTLTFVWLQSPTTMSFKNLPRSYTLAIHLVHCVSISTIFDLIVKREPFINKTDHDSDIEIEDLGLMTTRHRVSLICPISQALIGVPAKSAHCSHPTCFDLKSFLQMNQRRLQWTCPLCKKSASYDSLRVDERLQNVLANVPPNCSTVEIDSAAGCQYILDSVKQEKFDVIAPTHAQINPENEEVYNLSTRSRRQSAESDCIVLSSGSESEDETNDSSPIASPTHQQNGDINKLTDTPDESSHSTNSIPSPSISNTDDVNYWDDVAQMTYELSPNRTDENCNRKRSNSSSSSVLSSASLSSSTASTSSKSHDDRHRRKRNKKSSTSKTQPTDIEIITLSSSDSSNDDDQLT